LSSKLAKKGLAVQLLRDPAMRGVVLKKAGKNAQVDFSESGGESKKWEKCADLTIASTMQIHKTEDEPPAGKPPTETEQPVTEATDTDEDADEDVTPQPAMTQPAHSMPHSTPNAPPLPEGWSMHGSTQYPGPSILQHSLNLA
jgi:hypothetical protein